MKRSALVLCVILILAVFAGCGAEAPPAVSEEAPAGGVYTPDPYAVDVGLFYGDLPGSIQPAIRVGGKNYYFAGTSHSLYGAQTPEAEVYIIGNEDTCLPEGYTPVGEISSVTEGPLTEELQFRAGCNASGTVYTSTETPEVVYVHLLADWFDLQEPEYYRFISEEMKEEWILYDGNRYLISIGTGDCEALEELPDGCEKVGHLNYIGMDRIPENDLETNCPSDSFSKALMGRDVYFDPDEPEFLYVYEHHYWAEGDYPTYLACPIMEATSVWTPLYTGEDREWEHQNPWAFDALEGETREHNQEEGMEAALDIGYHGTELPGFAGSYLNCSGTLTVMLVDPQVKMIEEYAKASDYGFWIVAANYTQKELEAASEELFEEIRQWIEEHPEAKLQLGYMATDMKKNRVLVEFYGPSLESFYAEFDDLHPCVEVILHEVQDASMEAEIPRDPEVTWSALDGILTVSVLQPAYPVGVETVTVVLENNSLGQVMYGESYSVEKYVDGEWVNVSGRLAFNAIGLGLAEYDRKTLTVNTEMFPAPLGVGLYRITGTDLSYTAEDNSSVTVTEPYMVEFLVTEDAPVPTGELPNKEGVWLTEEEIIEENEIGFPIKSPYAAGLICNITAEGPQDMGINIYDRSTGEKLTDAPLWFRADYYQDVHRGKNGEILVESEGMTYLIDVTDGKVVVTEQKEPYDEQLPREPVTSAETYYGEISIAVEQGYYPAGADTIAFTITNNTEYDLSTENLMPCSELYNWEYNNCFRILPEGMTPEEELFQDPVIFTLNAGESKRVEMDLNQWYVPEYPEEGGEIQHSLGRGIYTMTFHRRTFTFSDGRELTASLTVEFVLE